ncbi:hypothetical protein [Apibacter adventoris]|uniref:hypothetical protein n=1 Tax=Apibacter adventoris TaxID=1679466 RepID=UPI000CF6559C|nr:hypothetical protein [Apibacter adventoris]PQL93522.1 hypothetical protein C4S76_07710 [Apibacter adventoris]
MTKVKNKTTLTKMHSHNFDFLPRNYCEKAQEILKKQGFSFQDSTIYSVKARRRGNVFIFQALINVEKEHKLLLASIENTLRKNF